METNEQIVLKYPYREYDWKNHWHEIPTKFPYVAELRTEKEIYLWTSKTSFLFLQNDETDDGLSPANEEESKLFWRYYKAWKLMNR